MEFTHQRGELEFNTMLHPESRALAAEVDGWLVFQGWPQACFTEVFRTDQDSLDIYLPIGMALVQRLATGDQRLTADERNQAVYLRGLSTGELRSWAKNKFSWHKVACAWDLRTVGPDPKSPRYTPEQQLAIKKWLEVRCAGARWELRLENHGTGPHYHVGRRDFEWRQNFQAPTPPASEMH